LQHALPKGFVKVRYYGIFAPGCRRSLMALRQQLELIYPDSANQADATPESEDLLPEPRFCCPNCGQPLLFQRMIKPTRRCLSTVNGYDSPLSLLHWMLGFALVAMLLLVSCQDLFIRMAYSPDLQLVLAGFLDVQFIHIRRFDGVFDLVVCLKFKIAQ